MLTYYFSVKARSGSGAWSAVSASDGIQYSTGAAIWWKFRNGLNNAGRQLFKGTRVTDLAWRIPTKGYVESSPAIASDGTTYIGSGDGKVYADHPERHAEMDVRRGRGCGQLSRRGRGRPHSRGLQQRQIYCLNPAGEVQWIYRANGPVRSSPLINGNRVYVGSNDVYLYAINIQTGLKEWAYKTGGALWSSPACDSNGVVYIRRWRRIYLCHQARRHSQVAISHRVGCRCVARDRRRRDGVCGQRRRILLCHQARRNSEMAV